jgi:hypothetical protein
MLVREGEVELLKKVLDVHRVDPRSLSKSLHFTHFKLTYVNYKVHNT